MLLPSSAMIAPAWFLLGIVTLIGGAELIVRGGSRVAALLGVSPLVVGLTIVSIGTSTPELAVGVEAALRSNGSLAVGNIAGTNTVNILLILGCSALLKPLSMHMQTLRFDLPVMIVAAVALLVMSWNGVLTRVEGALLVLAAIVYSAAITHWTRRESSAVRAEFAKEYGNPRGARMTRELTRNAAMLLVGIVVAVVGSDWLVDGAVEIAVTLGVTDAFIGLTIVSDRDVLA